MKKLLAILAVVFCAAHAKVEFLEKAYSYDDVLLVPQKSTVESRKQVSTKTKLTRNIWLNMPIISSNMDTVTEASMALTMAQLGGIGIIHRFNTIEQQVYEVTKVKRYRNAVIRNPLSISYTATLAEAHMIMAEHDIKGLLVVDEQKRLVGIITSRDIRFRPDEKRLVHEFMTQRNQLIVGTPDINIAEAKQLMIEHRIEKLPLVNEDDTIAGLITSKDIYVKAEYPSASIDAHGRLLVGAAIGVKEDAMERSTALVEAGVDVLVIDVAHGHCELTIKVLKQLKEKFPNVDVIAGNVATLEATKELIAAGADAIKVGIGPGSICTTRITTGSGYPQLSAVLHCAQEADRYGIPVIADGGIKYSGDITKAIAAGASTVMLGSLLAGTDESPGIPFMKNGKKYKVVRGMASFGANLGRNSKLNEKRNVNDFVPEGVEAMTPYKGSVVECVQQLLGGLYSGMSYCGATTIEQLRGNGIFVEITSSGIRESHPHDVEQLVH
jgi:IMP dehydrogenase